MARQALNYMYSLIGRFNGLYSDVAILNPLFPSNEFVRRMVQQLPTPFTFSPENVYEYQSKKELVRVSLTRVDVLFYDKGLDSVDLNRDRLLQKLNDIISKIDKKTSVITRVAINHSVFYHGENDEFASKICENISLLDGDTPTKELVFRQNGAWGIDNDKANNNIIIVQLAELQNQSTFEKTKGVTVSLDINSDASNQKPLDAEHIKTLFDRMVQLDSDDLERVEKKFQLR